MQFKGNECRPDDNHITTNQPYGENECTSEWVFTHHQPSLGWLIETPTYISPNSIYFIVLTFHTVQYCTQFISLLLAFFPSLLNQTIHHSQLRWLQLILQSKQLNISWILFSLFTLYEILRNVFGQSCMYRVSSFYFPI